MKLQNHSATLLMRIPTMKQLHKTWLKKNLTP